MAPRRMGLAHTSLAPYGVFKTKDGADILISIQSDREWRVLAEHGADIAFARVNDTALLARHPHLWRVDVATPSGQVSYSAPATRRVGEPRRYYGRCPRSAGTPPAFAPSSCRNPVCAGKVKEWCRKRDSNP